MTREKNHVIRPASFGDAPAIFGLIKSCPQDLVPRALNDIMQNIDRFFVCQGEDQLIAGTASWSILPEIGNPDKTCVEIKSVCVAPGLRRTRIGTALVEKVLERIACLRPAQVIVLTFAPAFFGRLGFRQVAKESLMHKLYMGCINCTRYDNPFTCPEIAMALEAEEIRQYAQTSDEEE